MHLPPGDTSTERTVHIEGTSEQVEAAKQLVNEVTSEVCLAVDFTFMGLAFMKSSLLLCWNNELMGNSYMHVHDFFSLLLLLSFLRVSDLVVHM